jgi:hypothetical protein
MSTVVRLSLRPADHAKVVPLEVLRDFADVTTGWSYLAEDSQHYSDLKDVPSLILRHRAGRVGYVDLGFVETAPETVQLAVLDRPNTDAPLPSDARADLLEAFLDAMRDYLSSRPDHVSLKVDRDAADPTSS